MKLSKRLQALADIVDTQNSVEIWDTCCDHGKLAFALTQKFPESKIYAVDVVDSGYLFSDSEVKFVKSDAALIEGLHENSCVIISGVGTDTALQILDGILERNNSQSIQFVVSTHSKELKLRSELKERGFKLLSESVLSENSQYYEILSISLTEGDEIAPIGTFISSEQDMVKGYYKKLFRYFSSKRDDDYSHVLDFLSEKLT